MAVFKSVEFRVVLIGPKLRQRCFTTRTAAEKFFNSMNEKYPTWEIRLEKMTTKLEAMVPRKR